MVEVFTLLDPDEDSDSTEQHEERQVNYPYYAGKVFPRNLKKA